MRFSCKLDIKLVEREMKVKGTGSWFMHEEYVNSQDYSRYRLFWKYAEIGYFGRLKLFPFHGLTRVHFSLFSENNGLLNIFMLK